MAQDYWLNERERLRQMLHPAPRPWPGAIREEHVRLLAHLDRLGQDIERQRRASRGWCGASR